MHPVTQSGGAGSAAHRLVPDVKVTLDGKQLDLERDAALTRVEVDLDVDLFGQCTLTFNDPKLTLINGNDFASGASVSVEAGFHTRMRRIFDGEVVALEPMFRSDLPPSLKVVCQEALHRLALSAMTRPLQNVDEKEIATRIAQEHGLTAEAPSGTKAYYLQANVSDAVALRRIAQHSGNFVRIEGRKLIVGPQRRGEEVKIEPGSMLRKLTVRMTAHQQVGEVTVHGWDPKTKKEIVAKAHPVGGVRGEGATKYGQGNSLAIAGDEQPPADTASAEAMAKGRLQKLADGFVVASGEMTGDPRVMPGSVLVLDGIGAGADGSYRVDHAHHVVARNGYVLKFRAARVAKKQPPKLASAASQGSAGPAKSVTRVQLTLLLDDEPAADRDVLLLASHERLHGRTDKAGKVIFPRVPQGDWRVILDDE